jgi:hypothetical protein
MGVLFEARSTGSRNRIRPQAWRAMLLIGKNPGT